MAEHSPEEKIGAMRDAEARHNTQQEYDSGGPQVSFEYEAARNAGLPYDVAKRIFDLGKGMGNTVYKLVEAGPKSVDALDEYIKSIGCWGDGTEDQIKAALFEHFLQ